MAWKRQPLNFKVKENEYEIKLPTVGQLFDIEENKSILSNGNYGMILRNRTTWSEYSLDNIDMFSYLSVMCPELMVDMKRMGVNTWKDLDPFDLQELKAAYQTQFLPWFSEFKKALETAQSKGSEEQTESEDDGQSK